MPQSFIPPQPKKVPHETRAHGHTISDPYFWMRERDNPEVIEHLKRENDYTSQVMRGTEALQEKLYHEILGRIKETDLSVPVKFGGYFYYGRTEKGKQYSIHCRKKGSLEAAEEILIDGNELAQGHSYFRIGTLKVSPDQNLLAYAVDTDGSETYTLRVKDLASGKLFPDTITQMAAGFEWAADNRTFFYTVLDEARRPWRLYRHRLGDAGTGTLVHEEKDERYFLSVYKTKDRRYLILDMSSKVSSECFFLDAAKPEEKFTLIHGREPALEYSVEHHSGKFLIVTNDGAVNFKLAEAPVENPGKKNWKDRIPARPDVKLEGLEVFRDYLVIFDREQGLEKIRVEHLPSGKRHDIEFPEPVYSAWGGANREFDSASLRFEYSSMVTPHSVYDYDMETRSRELKKQQEVLGGYDSSRYECCRVWAVSHDGVKVPVSLVYRKGVKRDGKNPLFLYGYGAYGISMDASFSSPRLSLLDRGFVFAIAHIRGGGDLGRPWYEDGKFLKKKNSFHDFIAAAEHLHREGWSLPQKTVICGGSAGGLLMGAVTNMRPDLFRAVIAMVPFVDVTQTMLDASLPLTVTEYDEWGDPNKKEFFECIHSYSPYDNVRKAKYPHILVTGGLNDPRVSYWEPAKWTAKLREENLAPTDILLKMEMGSGHGGPSGRYDALREIAFEYAFVLKIMGIGE